MYETLKLLTQNVEVWNRKFWTCLNKMLKPGHDGGAGGTTTVGIDATVGVETRWCSGVGGKAGASNGAAVGGGTWCNHGRRHIGAAMVGGAVTDGGSAAGGDDDLRGGGGAGPSEGVSRDSRESTGRTEKGRV